MSATTRNLSIEASSDLIDAIRAYPLERVVEHCGKSWVVSPFDLYSNCPQCGMRLKLRAFSACVELEDVFDAVFEWMNQRGAEDLVRQRREALKADDD